MQDKQIMNNIVLVQEVIHSSIKVKGKGMVIKFDMANSFDIVQHVFLFKVLEHFGLSPQFIK